MKKIEINRMPTIYAGSPGCSFTMNLIGTIGVGSLGMGPLGWGIGAAALTLYAVGMVAGGCP